MDIFKDYLKAVGQHLAQGNATEHTYRHDLEDLLRKAADAAKIKDLHITNEPKHIECGAPDFTITLSTPHGPLTIGYLECKDIGIPLAEAAKSDQLKRYFPLGNIILTDYLEFRWYVNGELRMAARIAGEGKDHKLKPDAKGLDDAAQLLTGFLTHEPEKVSSPKELAVRMARLTHLVRDIIITAFGPDNSGPASPTLRDLRKAFAEKLIPDLEKPEKTGEFADMYAQTIAYGLFAARCNHDESKGPFLRLGAAAEIPKTNPFLRSLFNLITGPELAEEPYAGFVDDLVSLLAHTEMDTVLEHFGKRTRQEDPVVHFYETFLAAYDPRLRESRGVYYTPEPVVSYIVRSVDHLLKTRFNCPDGLADAAPSTYLRDDEETGQVEGPCHKVLILDPACGTGTFLYSVVDLIRQKFMEEKNAGLWSGYVREHLLPRLFGFELLMAPYAVAHFKLGMQLAGQDLEPELRNKWAYDFEGKERLGVYLTNTLEEAEKRSESLFGPLRIISQEADAAINIKRNLPIMVIMGNPPYSGLSVNMGKWIIGLLKGQLPNGEKVLSYYEVDGKPLNEKKIWLQDDYVKFIRWSQWRIEKTGAGILAMITNHGYLDNPTFRGMRQKLMDTFEDIYFLDLHGNTKKKERAPDGSKDENVFDIQQGVAIGIFVKKSNKRGPAKVYHADLWGPREIKYSNLLDLNISTTEWKKLDPDSPFYFFVPRDNNMIEEYSYGFKITEIMPINSVGIVTARDHFTIKWSSEEVWNTVREFTTLSIEEAREKFDLGKDVQSWKVHLAQEDLKGSGLLKKYIVQILYRIFDSRFTYYTGKSGGFMARPLNNVMKHMINGNNLGLVCTRQQSIQGAWNLVGVTNRIIESSYISNKTAEINYLFPIYLYSSPDDLFDENEAWTEGPGHRRPNLNPEFVKELEERLKLKFHPHPNPLPAGEGAGVLPAGKGALSPLPSGEGQGEGAFGPEDIFHYIYAIFHSPTYRSRYAEFLKIDFPRVPLTSDVGLFRALGEKGQNLVKLHLLEWTAADLQAWGAGVPGRAAAMPGYPIKGDNRVDKGYPAFVADEYAVQVIGRQAGPSGRVYINRGDPKRGQSGQYFDGVPEAVWNFHVGGYQVCVKWLKDRRGRQLSYDDIQHYQKIVVALRETIRLMAEIDQLIPEWPLK